MSNFFYDHPEIATVPPVNTIEFLQYCETYRQFRRAQALELLNGTTVRYFSTSGSDSNDGLTTSTPKKTIGAAQAILSAWANAPSGLVLKFNCGDVWDVDAVGEGKLDHSDKYNVCITNYGDKTLGLPMFNRWKTPVVISSAETNVTRGDGFTNTYSLAKPGSENWYHIRLYGRKDVCFRHVSSAAEVDANPGTCWVDLAGTGRIYFRPFVTRTQLSEYYEGLTPDPTNTKPMFGTHVSDLTGYLSTGKTAIIGVEISGVSMFTYGSGSDTGDAIDFKVYGDHALYVLDSCITYCARHGILQGSAGGSPPSTAGGILFVDNCSVGWQSAASGSTLVTSFAAQGGTEFMASNCTVLGGYIPRPGLVDGGNAFLSHTAGTPYTSLFDIIYNCHATATPGNIANLGGYSNMSDPGTDIAACRHFIVNCSIPHRQKYLNENAFDGINRWSANSIGIAQWIVNCYVGCTQLGSPNNAAGNVISSLVNGNFVNCTISIDLGLDATRPLSDRTNYFAGANQVLCNFFSSMFETKNVLAGQFAWIGNQRSSGVLPDSQYKANRCVFVNHSSPCRRVNPIHNAVWFGFNTEQCGYFGISRYYGFGLVAFGDYTTYDPTYVAVSGMPLFAGGVPDELALAGNSYITFGGVQHVLEYDANGNPRAGRNAIGPYAGAQAIAEDAVAGSTISIPYDTDNPSASPYGEVEVIPIGDGRNWLFEPLAAPIAATLASDWRIRFSGFGLATPIDFTSSDSSNHLSVDTAAWEITAEVVPNHTNTFTAATWGTVDLWYQPAGVDAVLVRRKLARTSA